MLITLKKLVIIIINAPFFFFLFDQDSIVIFTHNYNSCGKKYSWGSLVRVIFIKVCFLMSNPLAGKEPRYGQRGTWPVPALRKKFDHRYWVLTIVKGLLLKDNLEDGPWKLNLPLFLLLIWQARIVRVLREVVCDLNWIKKKKNK